MEDLVASLSLEDLENYKYDPIHAENTIRILTLYPGEPGSRLEGRLDFANIDQQPKYEAISYVWGDPTRCDEIVIEGKSLGLTKSISDALQRMRHETETRKLWADQVCIDQDNLSERGHQVKFMSTIYKNTTTVLVWLGPDETKSAVPALEKFLGLKEILNDEACLKIFTENQRHRIEIYDDESWEPLNRFYHLPWFTRVWIEQEAGMGRPMHLFWGEQEYDWKLISVVSDILNRQHKPLRNRYDLRPSRVAYLDKRFIDLTVRHGGKDYYPGASFVNKLNFSRTKASTDPRDRIFANLGHFSATVLLESPPAFEADYTRDMVGLYIDVAIRTLKGYPTLELLNAVHHHHDEERLPSWVPNWGDNSRRKCIGKRDTWLRAAGATSPSFTIQEREGLLCIKGLDIDSIEVPSEELSQYDFRDSDVQRGRAKDSVVPRLWNCLSQLSTFQLKHEYISGGSALLAFCQVLSAGCWAMVRRSGDLRRDFHSIPDSVCLQHGAAYLTRVLGDENLVDDEVRKAAEGGDALAWNGGLSRVCHRRSLFRTRKGYYGLGPAEIQRDDMVVVLFGGTTPYVLRPTDQGYWFVGECYVHGLMNGEALAMMDRGELKEKTFVIR
ncbi:hypothetical protein ONS95_006963 [Cadophora gregata]|uniref:uncharacterized protein n=1 Tax=Cadophora gregata TaxID=51156 RepID=UPI0026DD8156|nr:uncharacterized protein ONS95_006963 [Cadophora gregata]KAK0101813.1 hypothetical protein ONS95_006963 [Cadophora gregata]